MQLAGGYATASRAEVERGIASSQREDPRAQAAVYYAYMDTLHREARGEHGGLRRVVALLRDHQSNMLVAKHAADVIAVLCLDDVATRDVFGSYGALEALLHTLFMCAPPPAAMERLLAAAASLVCDSPNNARLLERLAAVLPLAKFASSKRHEAAPDIALHALRCVAAVRYRLEKEPLRVTHKGDDAVAKVFLYCLRSMRVHDGREAVQEAALDALRALLSAADPSAFTPQLLERACRCAGNAYRAHGANKNIVWQALAIQCDVDEVRGMQTEVDIATLFDTLNDIVVEATESRGRHPAWTEAMTALVSRSLVTAARIGWRSPECKEAVAKAGAVDVCMQAVKTFAWNKIVIERVCEVLRSLFDSPHGRERLDCAASARTILQAIETTCRRNELTTSDKL